MRAHICMPFPTLTTDNPRLDIPHTPLAYYYFNFQYWSDTIASTAQTWANECEIGHDKNWARTKSTGSYFAYTYVRPYYMNA